MLLPVRNLKLFFKPTPIDPKVLGSNLCLVFLVNVKEMGVPDLGAKRFHASFYNPGLQQYRMVASVTKGFGMQG